MAANVYNSAKAKLGNGSIDWDTDTIKVALFTSSYVPNIDTDVFFSDISANEVTGTGYTAGGNTLAGASVTVDNTNDRAVYDANDPSWPASTITFRTAVYYKSTGTPSTSALVAYDTQAQDYTSSAGTLGLTLAVTGVFYIG